MKKVISEVLAKYPGANLSSEAARNQIAAEIAREIQKDYPSVMETLWDRSMLPEEEKKFN